MSKRANGDGSLHLRKDGRWEAAAYVPTLDGRRKRVRAYAKDRRTAHGLLIAKLEEVRRGIPTNTSKMTVADFLKIWLAEVIPSTVRRTTAIAYESMVRLYIAPRIGKEPLATLTIRRLQAEVDQMVKDGVSPRTIAKFRSTLSSALSEAVRQELILRNVSRPLRLPQYKPPERQPWSAEEAAQFLRSTSEHRYSIGYLLLLVYGLREGEVLGLRWSDVDLKRQEFTVRQQIQRLDGKLTAVEVKTDSGIRTLPIVPLLGAPLEQLAARTGADVSHPGPAEYSTENTVLQSQAGSVVDPANFRHTFERAVRAAQLRPITIHDTRHTLATLLSTLGIPAKVAQRILGHAHISTTQQIYQHDSVQARAEALSAVNSSISELLGAETAITAPGRHDADTVDRRSRTFQPQLAVSTSNQAPKHKPPVDVSNGGQTGQISRGTPGWARTSDLRLRSSAPKNALSLAFRLPTPVISALSELPMTTLMSEKVRQNSRIFGAVAVKSSRKLSPADWSLADVLMAHRTTRAMYEDAILRKLSQASFPQSLLPPRPQIND